ncbi:MAG TPA: hypothetical protein VFI31_02470 [Pirellulales bacterium]|nr:hypothetical protein [Pirellulales bacterium]
MEELRDRDSFRNDDEGRLRFYFTAAMAHQRLGQGAAARQCFTRAAQWLDRHKRISRLTGDYSRAESMLEAEVLRREAERLIYE